MTRLFVGNLSYHTDERGLRDAFSRCGDLVSARIMTDRETGRSRGFAFVEYVTKEAAEEAIRSLDGMLLDGRPIAVSVAKERAARGGASYQSPPPPSTSFSPARTEVKAAVVETWPPPPKRKQRRQKERRWLDYEDYDD